MTNKRKYIRPAGVFAQTPEGWKKYQAQDDDLQQIADEEKELDRVMDARDQALDAQHYYRESYGNMIDDMSVKERGL